MSFKLKVHNVGKKVVFPHVKEKYNRRNSLYKSVKIYIKKPMSTRVFPIAEHTWFMGFPDYCQMAITICIMKTNTHRTESPTTAKNPNFMSSRLAFTERSNQVIKSRSSSQIGLCFVCEVHL